MLPTSFSNEAGTHLINLALKNRENKRSSSTAQIFCDTIIVSEQILSKISSTMEQFMPEKAKEAIDKGIFKQQLGSDKVKVNEENVKNKKEDRRKKATGGKTGGGTQGRETKTKSTKNKHKGKRAQQDSDSEDDSNADSIQNNSSQGSNKFPRVDFLSVEELQEEISKLPELSDCPEELVEELAANLSPSLTQKFQEVLRTTFMATVAATSNSRKKTYQQLQEKISSLLMTIKLADKGAKIFHADVYNQLIKHLLKTYCSEVLNELVLYLADESMLNITETKEITPDIRLKIISKFPDDQKDPLMVVHKSLTAGVLEDFLNSIDDAAAAVDLMFKKKNNKQDRQVLAGNRSALIEQLEGSIDTALILHISCLILFQTVTGNLLHASGKFVPQIIHFLRDHLPEDKHSVLLEYQGKFQFLICNFLIFMDY